LRGLVLQERSTFPGVLARVSVAEAVEIPGHARAGPGGIAGSDDVDLMLGKVDDSRAMATVTRVTAAVGCRLRVISPST
jgi:hypothetical protein